MPSSFVLEQRMPPPAVRPGAIGADRGTVSIYEHNITWDSVNKPLPASLFTIDDLQCEAGTIVVNELDPRRTIIERVIGVPDEKVRDFVGRPIDKGTTAPDELGTPMRRFRIGFVLLNIFALILLCAIWGWRMLIRRRSIPRNIV